MLFTFEPTIKKVDDLRKMLFSSFDSKKKKVDDLRKKISFDEIINIISYDKVP